MQLKTISIAIAATFFISCQETNTVGNNTIKNNETPKVKTLPQPGVPSKVPLTNKNIDTIKPYKLTTCIVSDEELGSMGEPITIVYNNQEIKFCCKSCVKKFHASPEKYLAKLKPQP